MTTATKVTICVTGERGTTGRINWFYKSLVEGSVAPRGIELMFQESGGLERNTFRMLEGAYDVAEMPLGTFVKARAEGAPVVGLPVYTGWRFPHPLPNVRIDSDIWDPVQLKGRKVGLHVYWQSEAIWTRSLFRHVHGVEPKDITWITNRPERLATEQYPPGVEVRQDPLGRDTARMLLEGEVDAIFGLGSGGRPAPDVPFEEIANKRRYIYRDIVKEQKEYYRKTRLFPIMHIIGLREELAETQPWIVENLYEAFVAAKEHFGIRRALEEGGSPVREGTVQDALDLLGEDPFPHGIEKNRHVLETFLTEVLEQGHINKPISVENLFPSNLPESVR